MNENDGMTKRCNLLGSPEIRQIIEQFEQALFSGRRPRIEEAVPADCPNRLAVLEEMIHIEIEYLAKRHEKIILPELLERFPDLARNSDAVNRIKTSLRELEKKSTSSSQGARVVPPDEFIDSLVDAGLVTKDVVQSIRQKGQNASLDSKGIATRLVQAGKLSKFQASQALAGKAKALLMGEYIILERLGSGGMGQVYTARHRRMNRVVALKVLPPAALKDASAVRRFEREVQAAARLLHPNIVTAFDAGQSNGLHFLVMEYVEGQDLAEIANQRGALPIEDTVDYIRQAAVGLAYAHAQGMVHRDIKPANLILDKTGCVKVIDMGLARIDDSMSTESQGLTESNQMFGTIDFMAPEQAVSSHDADARSDIYSLGCSLYRLLTGEKMFLGATWPQIVMAHREQPIPALGERRPGVSPQLEAVYRRMVAKRPADRYQTMSEVVAALDAIRAGHIGCAKQLSPTAAWPRASNPPPLPNSKPPSVDRTTEQTVDRTIDVTTRVSLLAQAMNSEKSRTSLAKFIGGTFVTIVASIIVALVLRYIVRGDAPQPQIAKNTPGADVPNEVLEPASSKVAATQDFNAPEPQNPKTAPEQPIVPEAPIQPAMAVAPFDAEQAHVHQLAWARHLRIPVEQKNSIGVPLVLIPPGEFLMGSTPEQHAAGIRMAHSHANYNHDDLGHVDDEIPQHRVEISKPFLMSATEVTVAQFRKFVDHTKYQTDAEKLHFDAATEEKASSQEKAVDANGKRLTWQNPGKTFSGLTPVTRVSWNDAVEYCNWLSDYEKLPHCYRQDEAPGWRLDPSAKGYRMPTEAEWEFTCRAGSATQFYFGDDLTDLGKFAWYKVNSGMHPQSVARKLPNAFGIYDMHGNAWEWCSDWRGEDYYSKSPLTDPTGPKIGTKRVIRGGSCVGPEFISRSAFRRGDLPTRHNDRLGFRVMRSL